MNETPCTIAISARTAYVAGQSAPDEHRFVYAYTITIRNDGPIPAQLLDRHWLITDADGKVQEVRGEGVVGEQPRLEPGQTFEYTSAAMIETPVGSMHGSYGMITDDGVRFDAEIPAFSLAQVSQLH